MHLLNNRTQMTTKDGKNKIASHGSFVSDAMTCSEFFYDLLLTEARQNEMYLLYTMNRKTKRKTYHLRLDFLRIFQFKNFACR